MTRRRILSAILTGFVAGVLVVGAKADEESVRQQLKRTRDKYRTPIDWSERRHQLREEFLQGAQLWPPPERPAVKVIRHSRRAYDGYSVENVALETLPGFYCTANLYRPLDQPNPGPAILCPHGHFQPLGRFRENQQIRCAHLARMGATVFSYSMVGWHDSQQTTHDDPIVLTLQTWNSLRTVDFVSSLAGVDPKRIGVTGASGGGTQTLYLSLIDDRVKVCAPLVIVYPWSAPEGCLCEGGLPVMREANTNAIELAAAVSPRPQLLVSVGNDPTERFPEFGFPFLKHMYEVCGAGDRVTNVHFADEGHDFGPSKRKEVYEFFAKHLPMQLADEDLAKITIETPQQMEVFNGDHPLPDHAVSGSQAVASAFASHLADLRGSTATQKKRPLARYSFKSAGPADEALVFTPPGFDKVGQPEVARGKHTGTLSITIRDSITGEPTFCRVNVVGPDGNFYEPAKGHLKIHSLTGKWPNWPKGWGNRPTKAPIRYFGRFFYCDGEATVEVPAGTVRVEVWKGFEYQPETLTTEVIVGKPRDVEVSLTQTVPMPELGYWSGDPHIHIPRANDADERVIFDLMQAEDIHFGTLLAYNEPAGPYFGFMERMVSPQRRALGKRSVLSRGAYTILSGQEYRSATYGHLNLFMLDELVYKQQRFNADNWPPYGEIGRATRELGGYAFHAHGGYAQEIYADMVQGNVDGVELLQFGVYRGIGLIDWYRMLNAGFRFPATGASDYPACRKLGDCRTYVYHESPSMDEWLRGAAEGRSFVTTGPLLFLEVDGKRPGARINVEGDHQTLIARVRMRSEVAPVTHVQLIVNGRIVHETTVPASAGRGRWIEFERDVEITESSWIAARAFSLSSLGTPDAEAHTNPVYVYLRGKVPYDRKSLDGLVVAIDKQIAIHKKRKFPEQAKVIAYFEHSRDILMKIREAGGVSSHSHPSEIAKDLPSISDPGRRSHSDDELEAFLRPQPARLIEDTLRAFETVDGFEMQLVAREPLVHDPIAAAFDENGNLYVCEMRDYPYKPKEGKQPIGSVRLLRDTDGDGVFDQGHVFADQLLWAGGVAPWKGGVFVAACPDVWFLKDTDGDHRADIRRKVLTGFGTGNQQAMVNNLRWGLDHRIYGSTAGNGGTIRRVGNRDANAVSVNGRDFRFDPVGQQFEPITGTVQFGNAFNDWGDRFLCSESRPLLHAVLPDHYLARNPFLPVPEAIHNVAPGPVPIFRISPLERWRMIRSSRRIAHGARSPGSAGASHHVLDAAAGVTVYRGGAYPKPYYGNVFIGGAQNNVIHRRQLIPDGVTYRSKRIDVGTEFVRSSDNWFRPVNFVNAPDGTLYVLDMSREILETIHVPLDVAKFLDFRSGRKQGRIYRIAPPEFAYPGSPQLGRAATEKLVAALESPHGWLRDTAHRLIYERQDRSAVGPLRKTLVASDIPQARLHAIWSLHGLDALSTADIVIGLGDAHPRVREHAMRLAEPRLDEQPQLLEEVIRLASDDNPRVRFQSAFSLGQSMKPKAAAALARMARTSVSDRWIGAAVLSSSTDLVDQMLAELLADSRFGASAAGIAVIDRLATIVGSRNEVAEVSRFLGRLASETFRGTSEQLRIAIALGSGLKRAGTRIEVTDETPTAAAALINALMQSALETAHDSDAAESERVWAIRMLGCGTYSMSGQTLANLATIPQPVAVQIAAIHELSDYAQPDVAGILLRGWREHTPDVRQAAIDALLSREDRTVEYLRAAEAGRASIAQVEPSRRTVLLKHENRWVQSLAKRLFGGESTVSHAALLTQYQAALSKDNDLARGDAIFRRDCMACHKIGDVGHPIGPDLVSSPSRDAESLLVHILDPNRYVLPTYEQYVAIDHRGRSFTGMITAQTATSVTLTREENKTATVLRANIAELVSVGKSLMPEGFEKKIKPQEMADLIAFVQNSRNQTRAPLHIGTLPGLIEPDD